MKINITLYANGSSKNHGCEAIAFSTLKILKGIYRNVYISTTNKEDDGELSKFQGVTMHDYNYGMKKTFVNRLLAKMEKKMFGSTNVYKKPWISNVKKAFRNSHLAISVGGDNYCYGDCNWLFKLHKAAKVYTLPSILWGCSIEPNAIDNEMLNDLKSYDLIVARESITYNTLLQNGINKNTKIYPDPAFQLDKINLPLPDGFIDNNTIGINVSPLIMRYESSKGNTFLNYSKLLQHIINTTDMQIALIPHVVLDDSNDLEPLTKLYEQFKNTNRVVLIRNYNCMELKGFISRCKMFIGARTHATIAAYSTCVPTLVVGYSVKALGIARDIFGSERDMVIPVQSLENETDLINAFEILKSRENEIRKHLQEFMPEYIEKAREAGKEVKSIFESR